MRANTGSSSVFEGHGRRLRAAAPAAHLHHGMAQAASSALMWTGLFLAASAVAQAAPPARDGAADDLDCAKVSAEARNYAYGYNHVVVLSNQCQRPVSCEVWTNVDPTPHLTLEAKPGRTASVVTRARLAVARGSGREELQVRVARRLGSAAVGARSACGDRRLRRAFGDRRWPRSEGRREGAPHAMSTIVMSAP